MLRPSQPVNVAARRMCMLLAQRVSQPACPACPDPHPRPLPPPSCLQQNVEHWRGILRRLYCREEQLRKIVAGHQRYISRMRPVLEERKGGCCRCLLASWCAWLPVRGVSLPPGAVPQLLAMPAPLSCLHR